MTLPEKHSPAPRGVSKDRAEVNKNHLLLIRENATPRQRWRARVPFRRIKVSDELRAFLSAMGATHGE